MEYKGRTIMAKSQNLSTGPTSEEGKAISCQNSTKHGLTSVKLNTAEEQFFYETMVELFTEEHNPQGLTEKILVSDLAMIRIRLNRFDKAENALFFIEQDKQATPEKLLYNMGISDYGLRSELIKKIENNTNYLGESDPKEEAWCKKLLSELDSKVPMPQATQDEIRKKIHDECKLHNTSPEDILEFYGRFRWGLEATPKIPSYDLPESENDAEETNAFVTKELNKITSYHLKSYLENKYAYFEKCIEKQKLLKTIKDKLNIYADAVLPNQKELDRLYRYKTTLERQYSAKLSQLIQLQEIKLNKHEAKVVNK